MLISHRWAWQHPDRSRHITDLDDGTLGSQTKVTVDSKTGKTKARAGRSRRSLTAHLEDLHSLLRSNYFASWPLRIRFFCADVYRVWKIWNERVDIPLPMSKIILDGDCPSRDKEDDEAVGSVNQLQVDYTKLESFLEKSMFLLDDAEDLQCQVCAASIIPDAQQIVVCPQTNCRGTNHLLCLSAKFLQSSEDTDCLVPTQGSCPACKTVVSWPLMMQELTVRNRAEKEARGILRRKEKRDRKDAARLPAGVKNKNETAQGRLSSAEPTFDDPSRRVLNAMDQLDQDDPQLDDNWFGEIDLESESEAGDREQSRTPPAPSRLETVIEDSEWDDAELIE